VKGPDEKKELSQIIQSYRNYLDIKEPKSNQGIQSLVSREEMDAKRMAESVKKEADKQASPKQGKKETSKSEQQAPPKQTPEDMVKESEANK